MRRGKSVPELQLRRPIRRARAAIARAALALAVMMIASTPALATVLASVPASRDSALAFRPLSGAGDRFSVSDLTRRYERDVTTWVNPGTESAHDLVWLDRHGTAWPTPPSAAADTTDIDVVDEANPGDRTAMTPTEKDAAEPPPPPAQVGLPDPISIGLPLLGGLALLVQMIVQMAK